MPELKADDINNSVRRQLFSTAMLQEQLIDCCCEPPPPPPPRIADLGIEMSRVIQADQRSVAYTIRVTNIGTLAAENVQVENLPTSPTLASANFSGFSPNWTTTPPQPLPFRAKLGKLDPNGKAELKFSMQVGRRGGTFTHKATVSSPTPDRNVRPKSAMVQDSFPEIPA
jgi:hypothetical protein